MTDKPVPQWDSKTPTRAGDYILHDVIEMTMAYIQLRLDGLLYDCYGIEFKGLSEITNPSWIPIVIGEPPEPELDMPIAEVIAEIIRERENPEDGTWWNDIHKRGMTRALDILNNHRTDGNVSKADLDAVRIRKNGRILCAAMFRAQFGDEYIDDGVHYLLSAEFKLLLPSLMTSINIMGSGGGSTRFPKA